MEYVCCNVGLTVKKEDYFPDVVDSYLSGYIKYLDYKNVDEEIINNVKKFHNNIHMCLLEYYYGQHGTARFFFNKAVEDIDFSLIYSPVEEKILYRARRHSEEEKTFRNVFSKEEMFHIPLERRDLVSTERYSFPGLPCLYLGTSPEVCCLELGTWDDDLNIAKVRKKEDINVIDLSFFDKYDIANMGNESLNLVYSLWPIIACCSFTYNDIKEMKFRPDYILPQLLLEYLIDRNYENNILGYDKDIVGIRYRSVKNSFFDIKANIFDEKYINYVFPVLSDEKVGHCSKLKEYFEVIDVLSLREI